MARQPANHRALHWAQARVYGWLLCQQLGLPAIDVALVYLDITSQRETVLREPCTAADLRTHFEALCAQFLAWAAQEQAHRSARNQALAALSFPHGSWRSGQRLLAENVYTANRGLPLRVLALQARDKACEHPDKACHGDSCPLARGFYDKLPAARAAAVARLDSGESADTAGLRSLALAHALCPYYLTQELVRWADLVVADYHYQFDASALLPALAQANGWRVALLVDEAHNLVERARDMYSAALDSAMLKAARHAAPGPLQRPLQRLQRAWNATVKGLDQPYQVLDGDPPEALLQALQLLRGALADWLADHPEPLPPALQTLSLAAVQFTRLAETFGPHALLDLQRSAPTGPAARPGPAGHATQGTGAARTPATLCIRNLVPAPYLAPRLAAAHCSVLFSATLTPQAFYANTLGLPADTAWLDVPAPFAAEQLQVRLVRQVSTRWQHRAASVAPIVALMARQYRQAPGNYLAFFSSFDYLDQVAQALAATHPDVPMWCQTRGMADAERSAFLARFTPDSAGIGFAVLGGAFAEGIDLPGRRLIGAFIATLGLPQLNPVNEAMRERLQAQFGAGYDYTYLYPG
ncbi:MAG: ATP-dependent DNA helicase, partial [Pseudomonas sp. PGPPP3]